MCFVFLAEIIISKVNPQNIYIQVRQSRFFQATYFVNSCRQASKHRWLWCDWDWFCLCFASFFCCCIFSLSSPPSLPICTLLFLPLSVFISLPISPPHSLLKKIERETWRESGISLIATVTRLMERLLDYRWKFKPASTVTSIFFHRPWVSWHFSSQGLYEAGRSGWKKDRMHSQFTGESQWVWGLRLHWFSPIFRFIWGLLPKPKHWLDVGEINVEM